MGKAARKPKKRLNYVRGYFVRPKGAAKADELTPNNGLAGGCGVIYKNSGKPCRSKSGTSDVPIGRLTLSAPAPLTRQHLFAGLLILGCINGVSSRIIEEIHRVGWLDALVATFDIGAIVWISCCAGVFLVLQDASESLAPYDIIVAIALLVLVILPISQLSWIAVAALSAYALATSNTRTTRQGATILLATTVPMLWSRLLFKVFANVILNMDASLVSWLLGTPRAGNMVDFADGSSQLVILAPCSSLANMSLAILCWVTVAQLVGHKRALSDAFWCALACVSVVVINVSRMAIMSMSETLYARVHSPFGNQVVSLLITLVTVAICLLGVRRELFRRV